MVNNFLPPGGTPGIFDPRNPTILPNFDRNLVSDAADPSMPPTVNHASPAQFLVSDPRANASATATIGGSVTTGDILTIELQNGIFPGGLISHTYTTVGGDTVTTIAEQFADLFNADPTAGAVNVECTVAGAVITFTQSGPVGNFSTLVAPTREAATITIGGTARTGDSLNALFTGPQFGAGVLVSFNTTTGNTTTQMANGFAAAITANAALTALGISAANVAAVITLTVPAAAEPVTITSWAQTNAPVATVGGTLTVGDALQLTFTNAALPGGSRQVSYTTIVGDTTATMAANLAAVVNADAVLIAAGIGATYTSGSTFTVTFQPINGALTFTTNVTGGATETLAVTAAATETSTVGTAATETITFSNSGVLSGGSGPVLAANNFEFSFGSQVSAFFYGQPYDLAYEMLAAMVAQGMPIV